MLYLDLLPHSSLSFKSSDMCSIRLSRLTSTFFPSISSISLRNMVLMTSDLVAPLEEEEDGSSSHQGASETLRLTSTSSPSYFIETLEDPEDEASLHWGAPSTLRLTFTFFLSNFRRRFRDWSLSFPTYIPPGAFYGVVYTAVSSEISLSQNMIVLDTFW